MDWQMLALLRRAGLLPPPERIATDHVDGLIVSTIAADDLREGLDYETAITDADHSRPVQRYATRAEALEGHAKWVKDAAGLTAVIMLGSPGGESPPERVTLRRRQGMGQ